MKHSPEELAQATVVYIGLMIDALSHRLLTFLSLMISAGLFAWAMYLGTPLNLGIAACFALMVFIPILRTEKTGDNNGPG